MKTSEKVGLGMIVGFIATAVVAVQLDGGKARSAYDAQHPVERNDQVAPVSAGARMLIENCVLRAEDRTFTRLRMGVVGWPTIAGLKANVNAAPSAEELATAWDRCCRHQGVTKEQCREVYGVVRRQGAIDDFESLYPNEPPI